MSEKIVHVAVAVLQKTDGSFLLAQRPPGKPYEGYWEFPGGKVEPGEDVVDALKRELYEELGIEITLAYRWITRTFTYPHATVKLHFYRVVEWDGTLQSRENQAFSWHMDALNVTPMLPANAPVLKALSLPTVYAISNISEMGKSRFLNCLESACNQGLRLLQIREKTLASSELEILYDEIKPLAERYALRVLLNSDNAVTSNPFDGVHLSSAHLMSTKARPDSFLCGASCHNAYELLRAVELELDFIVLGPIGPTPSHPNQTSLGWDRFTAITTDYPLPVYALGGMKVNDTEMAYSHGAHGIALMRDIWGN